MKPPSGPITAQPFQRITFQFWRDGVARSIPFLSALSTWQWYSEATRIARQSFDSSVYHQIKCIDKSIELNTLVDLRVRSEYTLNVWQPAAGQESVVTECHTGSERRRGGFRIVLSACLRERGGGGRRIDSQVWEPSDARNEMKCKTLLWEIANDRPTSLWKLKTGRLCSYPLHRNQVAGWEPRQRSSPWTNRQ